MKCNVSLHACIECEPGHGAPVGQLKVTMIEVAYRSDHDAPGKPSQRDQDNMLPQKQA